MFEKRGSENIHYIIVLYYEGKILRYKLRQFFSDRQASSWWLHSKTGMQELKWYRKEKKLEHVVIHGQKPFPPEFLSLLEKEFIEIHRSR